MTVTFTDVGRSKKCWTAECNEPLSHEWLEGQIRKQGALGSSDIEFNLVSDTLGEIVVGVFRVVGLFKLSEPIPAECVEES